MLTFVTESNYAPKLTQVPLVDLGGYQVDIGVQTDLTVQVDLGAKVIIFVQADLGAKVDLCVLS